MRVLLEILLSDYHLCLARLPLNSVEYRTLQNGVRERNESDEEVIHVLCDPPVAQSILRLLAIHCPEIIDRVRQLPENNR